MKKCIIVGAGECDIEKIKKYIKISEDDICIAADGGLDYLLKAGIKPDMVIGDMDSLETNDMLTGLEVKKLPVEKDDTDMLAAIKEGLSKGYKDFEIYGALGGRFDHAMANIQCLMYMKNRGVHGKIIGDGTYIELIKNESVTFSSKKHKEGEKISVFAIGSDAFGVTERGLKYSLEDAVLKQEFPIGISNEFTGQDACISVNGGMLLLCVEIGCE